MNPKIQTLVDQAGAALKGKTLYGNACIDLSPDGVVFIYKEGQVASVAQVDGVGEGGCIITLTLDTLQRLQSGAETITFADIMGWGDVTIVGNLGLAEQIATILQQVKL